MTRVTPSESITTIYSTLTQARSALFGVCPAVETMWGLY
ncbi:hypothetical protein [Klebsiella phage vB_KpnS_Uniso31]|uniref:Uncharacterized protein n=1 Tax=Klebsiella phage vB_KpnS_Uniso31 TaxID=2951200 RepID=A0A9E7SXQ5_9CAUD|nr:hypothetical protein [Klebsiella phage vB_KpnS_Uniso31]